MGDTKEIEKSMALRTLRSALKQCRGLFLMYLVSVVCFFVVQRLYQQSLEPCVYVAMLLLLAVIIVFVYTWFVQFRAAGKRHHLIKAIESQWRQLPNPDTIVDEDYQEMIRILGESLSDLSIRRTNEQREMVDYYTTWVHQIKTPIAVMRLLLNAEDTRENKALLAELFRVEQYVEMALNYSRLGSDTNDLVVKEYPLDDLIRQTIRKYASQFIVRKLPLRYEGTDKIVVTDQKWFQCILEQLLSNAVKYTMSGSVTISVSEDGKVSVTDTGIGIAPEDLPRIFEKGFTGLNGRREQKSTGLGLYICRKAADKLGIRIRAESTVGEGTSFTLELPDRVEAIN